MNIALTIAGSDPSGGAGIQADLKVFHRFAVYGLSALSAATAQNTFRVSAIERIEGSFLFEQLTTLLTDMRPDALKTGMLLSADAVRYVAKAVTSYSLQNLVVDPVIISSSGASLLEKKAAEVKTGTTTRFCRLYDVTALATYLTASAERSMPVLSASGRISVSSVVNCSNKKVPSILSIALTFKVF